MENILNNLILLKSALLILDFSHQVIVIGKLLNMMFSSSNQERWKYLEVGKQRITRGLGDRSPCAVGSRGKAQVWGSGGLRLPEVVDFCSHAFKI